MDTTLPKTNMDTQNDGVEKITPLNKWQLMVSMVVFADDVFTAPWNSHVFTTHVECPNVM